eukprot:m.189094 g.189094  ORF g.189094 m.189094 type:complete len:319 (+) comp17544_c1_seq2:58-1014(+)
MASPAAAAAAAAVEEQVEVMEGACPSNTSMAGKAAQCQGCPGQAYCQGAAAEDPDQHLIDTRMNAVKRKFLVVSGKGGVGKSSVAANLSMALAKAGKKVGLVDLDICGPSVPHMLQVAGKPVVNSEYGWMPLVSPHYGVKTMSVGSILESNDAAVIWRGPRKTAIIKRFVKDTFWGRLDCLVFDTPPGTSDEHLTVVKVLCNVNPDGAIIVTTPQQVALDTIKKEISFCKKMNLKIVGIVENMSGYACPCCSEEWPLFSEGGAVQRFAEEYGVPYLGRIPIDPAVVGCADKGACVFDQQPPTAGARALEAFAQRIWDS